VPIHPTAVVDPRAEVDASADLGPYVVVDGPVHIGPRTREMAGAYLSGDTRIGTDNVIHPGAVVGHEPQHIHYKGAATGLRIGDRNVIREHAEIHRALEPGHWTEMGDDNFLMSHAHVAHDCRIGNRTIIATGAALGGHVVVEDQAFVSGNCVVHQHARVGRLAMMQGLARTSLDVPPFSTLGADMYVVGMNRVGLRRAGFDGPRIDALASAFRILFRARTNLRLAVARVEEARIRSPDVEYLLAFIRESARGVTQGPARGRRAADAADDS
jgi:UDP-N-acetylglucosamine acyltransferase